MRYAPASRLAYADQVAVPSLLDDFGFKLREMERYTGDRAAMLKLYSAKKATVVRPGP